MVVLAYVDENEVEELINHTTGRGWDFITPIDLRELELRPFARPYANESNLGLFFIENETPPVALKFAGGR